MKSPFWKTYVALALAAGLVAWIYLKEWNKEPAKTDKPKEKVFSLDKSKVQELTVTPASGEALRLVKEGGGWKMAGPVVAAADASEADALVSTLETLEVDEVAAAAPAHLAEFGLEKPKTTVGLRLAGMTEPLTLLLGDKTPDGSAVYAKVPTAPRVFTLPGYVEGSLNKKPFDFRDRDLLHVKREDVRGLEVTGPEGNYALARDKDEWAFTRPVATRAGRWAVDGLVGALEGLRMDSVAAENATDLKTFGLVQPERTVALVLPSGGRKTLQIGGSPEAGKHYAREALSSLVAVVPDAVVSDLQKGMASLRAKRLLDVSAYEVEGFEAEADGIKRVYARSTAKDKDGAEVSKWKRTAPDSKDVATNTLEDILFKLGGLEAQDFVDAPGSPTSYGLDTPALKLTLRLGGGKPPVSLEVGQKDGAVHGRRTGDSSLLKLDPPKVEEILKALKAL